MIKVVGLCSALSSLLSYLLTTSKVEPTRVQNIWSLKTRDGCSTQLAIAFVSVLSTVEIINFYSLPTFRGLVSWDWDELKTANGMRMSGLNKHAHLTSTRCSNRTPKGMSRIYIYIYIYRLEERLDLTGSLSCVSINQSLERVSERVNENSLFVVVFYPSNI